MATDYLNNHTDASENVNYNVTYSDSKTKSILDIAKKKFGE